METNEKLESYSTEEIKARLSQAVLLLNFCNDFRNSCMQVHRMVDFINFPNGNELHLAKDFFNVVIERLGVTENVTVLSKIECSNPEMETVQRDFKYIVSGKTYIVFCVDERKKEVKEEPQND